MTATTTLEPSVEQKDIVDFVRETTSNIIIQACAGSGKTTTLKLICNALNPNLKVLAVCFNKLTAKQFGQQLPSNVDSKTLHAVGMRIVSKCLQYQFGSRPSVDKKKAKNILDELLEHFTDELGWPEHRVLDFTTELNSFLDRVRETMTDPEDTEALVELANRFGMAIADDAINYIAYLLKRHRSERIVISFSDMIDHPVHHDLPLPAYDVILIDEAQDLNPLQLELVRRLANQKSARVIAVGDKRQAIYAWRGADSASMQRIESMFKCHSLPLSVCYRCSRAVVASAQEIVGEEVIKATEWAPEGATATFRRSKLSDNLRTLDSGDMVVCRTSAPLVGPCFEIIRDHRKATIRGKDIGKGLTNLINKVRGKEEHEQYNELDFFVNELRVYSAAHLKKLRKRKQTGAVQVFIDQVDTLDALIDNCNSVSDLIWQIERIFSNDAEGVIFSTIHKSKGLEAPTVMLLAPELIPHPMVIQGGDPEMLEQESNLDYVARTRAIKYLIFQRLRETKKEDGRIL